MPFDGIVTKCIVNELNLLLSGGRVDKVYQPEADEIVMLVRSKGQNYRLVASANSNYPRLHITTAQKENPKIPPVFCMLMRKHIAGGKFLNISFHDYERVISINVESVNELGDLSVKRLVIEIMGKHSNIILLNSEDKIIDAVKHIDNDISSVREVMPARPYFLPPAQNKQLPEDVSPAALIDIEETDAKHIEGLLLNSIKGFSPYTCRDICAIAGVVPKTPMADLLNSDKANLISSLSNYLDNIKSNSFEPCIIYEDKNYLRPVDFYCFKPAQATFVKQFELLSVALDHFYSLRDTNERLGQKKGDVVKVVKNGIDRCEKKVSIFNDKLRDIADREKLQLFGELITANIYCIPSGAKSVRVLNYYSENEEYIEIPLNEYRSAQDNAQKYFKQYSKAKSTHLNVTRQLEDTFSELQYLESVKTMLENCNLKQEIDEIRQELIDQGYIKSTVRNNKKKKLDKPSAPLEFVSRDGFTILVGKNNKQNDLLTLKTAGAYDLWLHTKNIPGSHVIIRTDRQEVPDTTLLEAALLASYHSSAKLSSNVPVDYTIVKNVKKPSGAKPGMVIYESFKTIIVTPDEDKVIKIKQN